MSYSTDPESYWNERINDKCRYSSVGKEALPNTINKYRREKTFGRISQTLENNSVDLENSQVLDAGCGTGIYSEFYSSKGANVFGIDLSQQAVNKVEQLGIPGSYQQSSLNSVPFDDNEFDLVHCFSVLYHIVDDQIWKASLDELDRVTKTDGYLFLRIAWTDEEKRPGNHVKIRSKNDYIHELCEKRPYSLIDAHPLHDEIQYEEVFKAINKYFPTAISESCSLVTKKMDLFKEHSEQKLVVLKKE
ncbi:class I SAM-dependent methyltransferase [Natrialba asiatica]|uniref:Type 11 methyltransferase n=1 Tax=Natrialba asiatica (strain ATCC 700177 / DSM 12278 / JCM 9576 / FERM P-10747 / NBRC 102637 / 172P1) TaxID=29540 RepID=M0B358_NATA1|nr:class I SAM-dependent methyltransferase [Natrialba asiatica]ELZ04977.1 type 11 methyltransferase [Natrialba asiatica DSM 12278]